MPCVNPISVEVAFAVRAPNVVGVKAKDAALPEGHPVRQSAPMHRVAAENMVVLALVAKKLVVEAMAEKKSVVVACVAANVVVCKSCRVEDAAMTTPMVLVGCEIVASDLPRLAE